MRALLRIAQVGALVIATSACATTPIVAPLRYDPVPPAPEQAFRSLPPDSSPVMPTIALPWRAAQLQNGLRVLHLERHDLPIVSLRLVIARGSADAGAARDLYGILAVEMGQGTASRSAGALAEGYAQIGASHGLSFGADGCGLSVKVGAAGFDAALALVAEQVMTPRLSAREFSNARLQWSQDFQSSQWEGGPSLSRNTSALLFGPRHGYGFFAPSIEHTSALRPEAVVALHARLFQPAHATLVVVGDVTPEVVDGSAERWLGRWVASAEPLVRADTPAILKGQRVVLVERRNRSQVNAAVLARTPGFADADLAAVEVLTRALGGLSSPLRHAVRQEDGAAYAFGAGISELRAASYVSIGGAFDAPKAGGALRAILAAIRSARAGQITAANLERAQASLLAELRSHTATSDGLVSMASAAIVADVPPESIAAVAAQLRAVTLADVQRVATRYFADEALRVVVFGDGGIAPELAALGLGMVERRNGYAEHVGW